MPTLEPRLAGLTKQGYPSSSATRRRQAPGVGRPLVVAQDDRCGTTGSPWARNTAFIVALSIPTAEARTPAPT